MRILNRSNSDKNISLALGFFDCLHLGHKQLFDLLFVAARKRKYSSCVLTFDFDLKKENCVYPFEERTDLLLKYGFSNVLVIEKGDVFLSAACFLEKLYKDFGVRQVVCGKDFLFGKDRSGNVETIAAFAMSHEDFTYFVADEYEYLGKKLASSDIKELLSSKQFDIANSLSIYPYCIFGVITHGYHLGTEIGFPTANIDIPKKKFLPPFAVYAGICIIEGKSYKAIINIGSRPTFSDSEKKIECHLLDSSGDMYGKKMVVIPQKYLRDIRKFDTKDALISALTQDEKTVRLL